MLIIISDTQLFANEAYIINSLFEEGLMLFHLRKYNNSISEIRTLISEIKPEYRNRIVLHQFHEMAIEFGLKRLHFSESDRKRLTNEELMLFKINNTVLSTSVHSLEEYWSLSPAFDYAFLSPVFDSISKPGYNAQSFDLTTKKDSLVKLIALGGVKEENCAEAFEMGFDGVALLGSIWKCEKKIERFRKVRKIVLEVDTICSEK